MNSFKRSLVLSLSSVVLLAGIIVPAAASAASSSDGTLKVYVEVNDNYNYNYNNYNFLSPSDFTVRVSGDDVSKESFRGSENGTTVHVDGWYSVSISNQSGYTPSYSSGCFGDLSRNDTRTCRITMTGSYNYYNYYNQYPQQTYYPQQYYYQQPFVVSKYVPALPNTGFEPVNSTALAFVLASLAVALLFVFPYVRKALTTVLR